MPPACNNPCIYLWPANGPHGGCWRNALSVRLLPEPLIDRLAFIDRHLSEERNQGRITLDGKEQTQRSGTYRSIALASASDGPIANAS